MTEVKKVVAISAEVENEQTGAITNYHVPHTASYDLNHKTLTITFASYVNKKAHEKGKAPVGYFYKTQPVENVPEIEQAIFENIVANSVELVDAELVYAE